MNASRICALLTASALLAACGSGDEATTSAPAGAPEGVPAPAADSIPIDAQNAIAEAMDEGAAAAAVLAALGGDHRSDGAAARDVYRHPLETLQFFGIEPDDVVVEVWPGGGSAWYTEVLAPTLSAGKLVAAGYDPAADGFFGRAGAAFAEKVAARPDVYGNVEVAVYQDPATQDLGADGSADAVLLFRLYHNAIRGETNDDIMADAFAVLKPGGVLGVVQHRSPEDAPDEADSRDGYVKVSTVVADAEAAGFVLDAQSEINANEADTHDHPEGVWTLPPVLALCGEEEGDAATAACEAPWRAIGESDRMTLRFVKPAA